MARNTTVERVKELVAELLAEEAAEVLYGSGINETTRRAGDDL